jgi:hypothetical protein
MCSFGYLLGWFGQARLSCFGRGGRRCCCRLGLPVALRASHALVGSDILVRKSRQCRCPLRALDSSGQAVWVYHPTAWRARGRCCRAQRRPHARYFFLLLSCDLSIFPMIDKVANLLCSTINIWYNSYFSSLAKISLLCPFLDHSLLIGHNVWRLLLCQMGDRGDRLQPRCLWGSKGQSQMLQGTLVSLSISSDRSNSDLFSNLHMFLVSLTGRSCWTSCQGNTHQSCMVVEVWYRAHLHIDCLCYSPLASSTS